MLRLQFTRGLLDSDTRTKRLQGNPLITYQEVTNIAVITVELSKRENKMMSFQTTPILQTNNLGTQSSSRSLTLHRRKQSFY